MTYLKYRCKTPLLFLIFGMIYFQTNGQDADFWKEIKKEPKNIATTEIPNFRFEESAWSVEAQLEKVLDSLADQSRKAKRIQGYRILIYSGNSREDATRSKEQAYKLLSNADVYTSYLSPTFKVKLGDFYQKLDAFLVLKKIQAAFPMAVIVEEVVNLKL